MASTHGPLEEVAALEEEVPALEEEGATLLELSAGPEELWASLVAGADDEPADADDEDASVDEGGWEVGGALPDVVAGWLVPDDGSPLLDDDTAKDEADDAPLLDGPDDL